MRDISDLKYAFGQADDGFRNNIRETLAELRKNETREPAKRFGLRFAIAVVAACAVITATVLAVTNTWGILDFLSGRYLITNVLPGAAASIQTDVPQTGGKTELAVFSLREAFFDGQNIYAVVDVKPSSPKYLLLGTDATPSDTIRNMGPLFDGKTGTIAEYARAINKDMIRAWIHVANANGADPPSSNIDFLLNDTGDLVFMISCRFEDDSAELDIKLDCGTAPFDNPEDSDMINPGKIQTSELSFTLANLSTGVKAVSAAPAVYNDFGVRVDRVTFYKSPVAIYTSVEYTVIDSEKYNAAAGGFRFKFVDADGKILPPGAGSGYAKTIEGDGSQHIQLDSLRASETLPSEVILRGYCDGNLYESHSFEMN